MILKESSNPLIAFCFLLTSNYFILEPLANINMNWKLILLILLVSNSAYSQTTKTNAAAISVLEDRIKVLEGQKDNLNKQSDLLKDDFVNKADKLNTQFEQKELEMERELTGLRNLLHWFSLGGLGLLISGFFFFRNFIQKRSEEIATTKIQSHIGDVVETNREKIIELIRSQDLETTVKKDSEILVVTKDSKYLKQYFSDVQIEKVTYDESGIYNKPKNKTQLIIFDGESIDNTNHQLFDKYMTETKAQNLLYIFFGGHFDPASRENLNFANSKFTLYNHILNSLKYKKIKEQTQST